MPILIWLETENTSKCNSIVNKWNGSNLVGRRRSRSRSEHKHVLLPDNSFSSRLSDYWLLSYPLAQSPPLCFERSPLWFFVCYLNSNKFRWDMFNASESAKYLRLQKQAECCVTTRTVTWKSTAQVKSFEILNRSLALHTQAYLQTEQDGKFYLKIPL